MKGSRAFSLVELLAAVAAGAALVALLGPALAHGLDSARRAACLSNLRQIYAGYVLYAADHGGHRLFRQTRLLSRHSRSSWPLGWPVDSRRRRGGGRVR